MQEFSSWNSHALISLFWDILQPHSMPSEIPATAERFSACCWACNFPSLVTLLPHTWPPPGQKHPLIICSLCSHLLLVFSVEDRELCLEVAGISPHVDSELLPKFQRASENFLQPSCVHSRGVEWRWGIEQGQQVLWEKPWNQWWENQMWVLGPWTKA